MSAPAPGGRRYKDAVKSALNSAMKDRLCAPASTDPAAATHVAALLAFTPSAVRDGGPMVFTFPHAATGQWAVAALSDPQAKLMMNMGAEVDSARVLVFNAPTLLSRYGFREGHWQLGHSLADPVEIIAGALHAGGSLSKHSLTITCPTSGLMLTLMAALARLDIVATPTTDPLGVSVGPRVVPAVLNRLGLDDIADQYAQLVWPNGARP